MLEIPVYLLVAAAMGVVAVHGYVYTQRHLHVLEALSVMTGARTTMMEYRAVTGSWPASNSNAGFSYAIFNGSDRDLYRIKAVQIREGGAIDVRLSQGSSKDQVVSIRAWEEAGPGLPVGWMCAHAPAPPGTTAATDQTTMTDDDLPSPCRAHK
jgi:hypothetical protein